MVDEEALKLASGNAESSLERQFQTLSDIDTKASKIMRINVLIIGAVVSGVSVVYKQNSAEFIINHSNLLFLGSGTFLFLSTVLAGITYTASQMRVGIGAEDLKRVLDEDLGQKQTLQALTSGYSQWQKENRKTIRTNSVIITFTILSLIYSVIFLGSGALVEIFGLDLIWLSIYSSIICLIIAISSISYLRKRATYPYSYVARKWR